MKIKSQRDFAAGLMFIAIGVAFAVGALNYTFGSSAKPGPAFFPFGLGMLLALLGAMVLFKALTIESVDGEPIGHIAWKPLLVILGSAVVFGIALPTLGLIIALPILVIGSSAASEEFTWLPSIASSVLLTILCWLVFVKGLGLTIPMVPAAMG